MGKPVTDLLQARVGAERVAAVKALAKRKGMTMQSLVSKLIDEATGVVNSHTDVIRPVDGGGGGGGGAVLAELKLQTALLEQLVGGRRPVEEIAENSAKSVVSPASAAVVPAVEVDGQQLVAGVRARSQRELEEWLNLRGSEEEGVSSTVKAVVNTPSPVPTEGSDSRERRERLMAAAAAARAAAEGGMGEGVFESVGEDEGVSGGEVLNSYSARLRARAGAVLSPTVQEEELEF